MLARFEKFLDRLAIKPKARFSGGHSTKTRGWTWHLNGAMISLKEESHNGVVWEKFIEIWEHQSTGWQFILKVPATNKEMTRLITHITDHQNSYEK